MRLKITLVAFVAIFMASCKAKKAATDQQIPVKEEITEVVAVVKEKPAALLSPVAENPETIQLASIYDGKNLYEQKCANCHKLFKAEDFSREDWVPIMKRMQKKARITDAETLAIYNYIAAQTN